MKALNRQEKVDITTAGLYPWAWRTFRTQNLTLAFAFTVRVFSLHVSSVDIHKFCLCYPNTVIMFPSLWTSGPLLLL